MLPEQGFEEVWQERRADEMYNNENHLYELSHIWWPAFWLVPSVVIHPLQDDPCHVLKKPRMVLADDVQRGHVPLPQPTRGHCPAKKPTWCAAPSSVGSQPALGIALRDV